MTEKSDFIDQKRWEGLMRASILSATTRKLYGYINLADQKAMGLIVLNSIIIPLAMNSIQDTDFKLAATVAIITSIVSVFLAIVCVFPKRRSSGRPDGENNLLHFADIGNMSEDEYLEAMMPIYNEPRKLAKTVLRDLHDVSQLVLVPKFKLLKSAYIIFFIGNLAAILIFMVPAWH
jgi:hypothetical protein